MANNGNNDDGIDYNDVKKYAKITGVNVHGKKKAVAIEMVLDGIVAHYKPAKDNLSQEDFEEYKRVNAEMLDWFNKHKEYENPEEDPEQEDYVEPELEEGVDEEDPGQEDGVEHEPETTEEEVTEEGFKEDLGRVEAGKDKKGKTKGKAKKDLAKTKDGIKKAKAEAEKKKAGAAKKKAEAKTTTSRQLEKDEFGFVVGSKKSQFAKAISEKPCTMFEIKKMDWNDRMAGFYDTFSELLKNGLASRDDKGRMSMVKNKK